MLDARSNTPMLGTIGPKKVKRFKLTLRSFFILFTAFIFLFNSVGGGLMVGESWAAKAPPGLPSVGPESAGGPTPLKELSADTFTLPPELGYIQESAKLPNSSKTVIHIQDAHCNYAAQKSIANILNYLTKEYGVSAVNCEGGAKGYDLSVFTNIQEKEIREKTSDFFVKEGIVNAAEFFASNNPDKVNLWGVEDPDLYIKNLKIYRDSLTYKFEVDRDIKSISYILDNLKKHIYSPQLLDFDNSYAKYKDGQISFRDYIKCLIATAEKSMISIKSFPDIYLLSQTFAEEDKIDFKRANNEKDEVVDKLKKVLSKNELEELLAKVAQMKIERISQAEFYAYLVKKAMSIKVDLKKYPELEKYIIYISIYSAIDRTKVAKEMDALEDKIKESMYENDTQRELGILSKNLTLEKNMFNISLTRDDYTYYQEHRASFSVDNFTRFIDAKAPLYKIQARLEGNIARLDVYREKMEAFYGCSLERDKSFVKNIKFTDHDRPSSIIITGGFHTQDLRELFGKENVSYVSIMPKFSNPPGYESPYLKRLAGQRTALENVIDTAIPAVLNLQVVNILSTELAVRVEGSASLERFRLAVLIMAALQKGQQFIFNVNSKAYPKENKPQEDKIIVFNRGEGGNISSTTVSPGEPDFTKLASVANASLTDISANTFLFSTALPQTPAKEAEASVPVLKAPPATLKGAPLIAPFARIPSEGAKPELIAPAEPQASTAAKSPGEPMYVAAQNIVPEIASALRKGSPTYLISPVASEEDVSLTSSNNRKAEQILDKQGQDVHVKSYLAKGNWETALKELLQKTLPDFVNDQPNPTTRMAIRLMPDSDGRIVREIRDIITKYLDSRGYSAEQIERILDRQIHFIPISVMNIEHLNASIDLFTDIGMMEIDRYRLGDYQSEEMPPELKDRFLALLKLSITNFDDFKTDDVKMILDSIFKLNVLLRIKPVDWKSIDSWKKAQDAILKSL